MERLEAYERSITHMDRRAHMHVGPTWPSSTPHPSQRVPMADPFDPHRREVDAGMRVTISQEKYHMPGSRVLADPW
jgi:hypothetical protein